MMRGEEEDEKKRMRGNELEELIRGNELEELIRGADR